MTFALINPSELSIDPSELSIDVPRTAFGDLRVAAPYTLADIVNKYNIDADVWDVQTVGTGAVAHVPLQSAINLTSAGALNDAARIRTHTYYRYQAGKGGRVILTCIHNDAGKANQRRDWGLFDDSNGFIFRLNGTDGLECVIRSGTSGSAVDNAVGIADWNVEPNYSVDVTKGNIYEIAFQWLGAGLALFYINGDLVHVFQHPNTLAVPYMTTAVLPVACEVVSTVLGDAGGMRFVCASVRSEGGSPPPEIPYAFSAPYEGVQDTLVPLFSVRVAPTLNSVENRIQVFPRLLSWESSGKLLVTLVLNPQTLTDATWAATPPTGSGCQIDTAATAITVGTGREIGKYFSNNNEGKILDLETLFSSNLNAIRRRGFNASSDVMTVAAVRAQGGTIQGNSSLAWGEVR